MAVDLKKFVEQAREDILYSNLKIKQFQEQINACRYLQHYLFTPNGLRNEIGRVRKLIISIRSRLPQYPENDKDRLYTILTRILAYLELMVKYADDTDYIIKKFDNVKKELNEEEVLVKNAFF